MSQWNILKNLTVYLLSLFCHTIWSCFLSNFLLQMYLSWCILYTYTYKYIQAYTGTSFITANVRYLTSVANRQRQPSLHGPTVWKAADCRGPNLQPRSECGALTTCTTGAQACMKLSSKTVYNSSLHNWTETHLLIFFLMVPDLWILIDSDRPRVADSVLGSPAPS